MFQTVMIKAEKNQCGRHGSSNSMHTKNEVVTPKTVNNTVKHKKK